MGLDHLEREGGGNRGVEGVAAFFQGGHAYGGGDPVRGRDHAEGTVDLGACREWIGVDVFHAILKGRE
jgi:hypothetical protein